MTEILQDSVRDQEIRALAYLVQSPDSIGFYGDRLHEIQFQYGPARDLLKVLLAVHKRYGQVPILGELLQVLREVSVERKWPLVLLERILSDAQEVYAQAESVTEVSGETLVRFIATRELHNVAREMTTFAIDRAIETIPKWQERLEAVQLLTVRDQDLGVFPFQHETVRNSLTIVEDLYGGAPTTTGFPQLNHLTLGGFRPGELGIVVAATGVGKSLFMVQLALNVVKAGGRVVYYALDNILAEMMDRFYASVTGWDMGTPRETSSWGQALAAAVGQAGDRLLIKDYPPQAITTRDVIRHLRKARLWFAARDRERDVPPERVGKIDLVIVDYGDQLRAQRHSKEPRHELKEVFESLVALGKTEGVPVLTATQGNRDSLSAEVVTLQNLSEAFAKAWPASHVWCICQTLAERHLGRFRLAIVKARRPESQVMVPMLAVYRNMRVIEDPDQTYYAIEGTRRGSRGRGSQESSEGASQIGPSRPIQAPAPVPSFSMRPPDPSPAPPPGESLTTRGAAG